MKKKLFAIVLGLVLILTACGSNKDDQKAEAPAENAPAESNEIVIGVSPVPHEEIIENLKDDFKEAGLDVKVVVFDDYIQPNIQTNEGDLDANFYQHTPYLDAFNKEQGTDLVSIGGVHIEPLGVYSDKISDLNDLPEGATIIIPNDTSNGARALLILEKNGVIKLKDSTDVNATEQDIVENPKNIKFVPMEAASIAGVYKDADAAVINSNYALGAGLNPGTDSIAIEDAVDNPYANIVVVKNGREGEEKFKKFMEVLQSEKTKKFIEEKYEGAIIPAF